MSATTFAVNHNREAEVLLRDTVVGAPGSMRPVFVGNLMTNTNLGVITLEGLTDRCGNAGAVTDRDREWGVSLPPKTTPQNAHATIGRPARHADREIQKSQKLLRDLELSIICSLVQRCSDVVLS